MNEKNLPPILHKESDQTSVFDGSTIRSQLLWASLFPLVLFGLLSTLVIYTILNQTTLKLALERNSARVQALTSSLGYSEFPLKSLTNADLIKAIEPIDFSRRSQLYLIDQNGNIVASSEEASSKFPSNELNLKKLSQNESAVSQLLESTNTNKKIVVSSAAIPNSGGMVLILIENWADIHTPVGYYQAIIFSLLFLGTILSLVMLSVSIERVTRPISILAENATGAVPGSVFHPIMEHGPKEIRDMINAFNNMVIRLAEQQAILRQYAHKALLSQEEERQRLSHELHDSTMQDLVGLIQRVELCRIELDHDPAIASRRLDELQQLLGQTLNDVRRMSYALRPPVLEDFGLSIAVDALCKDMRQEKPQTPCEYLILGQVRRLQGDLELAIYRVIQEALTNIRKHAPNSTFVQVRLKFAKDEILAEIENDGSLFVNQGMNAFVNSTLR